MVLVESTNCSSYSSVLTGFFAEYIYIYIFTTAFRLTGDFVSTGLGKVEEETAEYTKSAEHTYKTAD